MLGCSTICPKCRHEFTCCPATPPPPIPSCCASRRSLHALSGGGIVSPNRSTESNKSSNNLMLTRKAPPPPLLNVLSPLSPQVSPSVPLAFILPFPPVQASPHLESKPETELKRLSESVRLLRESGWYHEGLSWQQSQAILKGTEPGTFLIRDSSDPRFLYALSVQTEHGPTSVRLHYTEGKFRLDSEAYIAPLMPLFDSVLDLIVYYVKCSARTPRTTNAVSSYAGGQVWVDPNGCIFARIFLKKPLLRADRVPSLQHLARLAVHRALEGSTQPRIPLLPPPHTQLELPTRLVDYLAEYPYSL